MGKTIPLESYLEVVDHASAHAHQLITELDAQREAYRVLRREYKELQEKYLTLRDGAVFVELLELAPQHDAYCDELNAQGMRCHCKAWFAENQ